MLLRVGELARRTGLTVRTLHHDDEICLLTPSGRSDTTGWLMQGITLARLFALSGGTLLVLAAAAGALTPARHMADSPAPAR